MRETSQLLPLQLVHGLTDFQPFATGLPDGLATK